MATTEFQNSIPKRELRKRERRIEQRQTIAAEYNKYRAISLGSVLTATVAVLSIPAMLLAHVNPFILVVPLCGVLIGTYTALSLRRREDEYSGLGYARTGLAISALTFGIGAFFSIYTYATEVPEGYERISFRDLQPNPTRSDIPFSPRAAELSESKVFVKGYVYPDGQFNDIKRFVLVPDMGTCCFGGQPKLSDMIQVTLEDPWRTEYSYSRRSFAGTFRLGAGSADKVGSVIYHLDADYAK